jgi:KDO2-lipid IV(A) lauroyltransferase
MLAALKYFGVSAPVKLLRSLPFATAFRLGERLGDAAYVFAASKRKTALVNLRIALPERSRAEHSAILRESFRNLGRMGAEFCHFKYLNSGNISTRVSFQDPERWRKLQNMRIGKTAILVLTGHFGNWELLHYAYGLYGVPIHLIVRPFRNISFDAFVNGERWRAGTITISKHQAARPVLKVLRKRGIVVVPFDQNATGRWGVFADFFSVPASTHPGLARFALISNAIVLPVFLVRQNGSPSHQIHILPEVEVTRSSDRDHDTLENTLRFNRVLEEMVRRYPEQWIWVHKRWRTRPPGEPPIY